MRWQTLYEARWIFAVILAMGVIFLWVWPWLLLLTAGLILFVLYFFRDPVRMIPTDADAIVSPADGKVADISGNIQLDGYDAPMVRIGIFLSVLDVHVNRIPLAGKVIATEERVGKYLDARHPEAGNLNACRIWDFESAPGVAYQVRQITGASARRIVPWSKPGDSLVRGEHFGMIRFGSRTELYYPQDALTLTAKVGDKVLGGSSILAKLKS